MDSTSAAEAQRLIQRIQQLATDIEQVPNFGPDLGSMRKIDKECQEIQQCCQRLSVLIGTGDAQRRVGQFYSNTGNG